MLRNFLREGMRGREFGDGGWSVARPVPYAPQPSRGERNITPHILKASTGGHNTRGGGGVRGRGEGWSECFSGGGGASERSERESTLSNRRREERDEGLSSRAAARRRRRHRGERLGELAAKGIAEWRAARAHRGEDCRHQCRVSAAVKEGGHRALPDAGQDGLSGGRRHPAGASLEETQDARLVAGRRRHRRRDVLRGRRIASRGEAGEAGVHGTTRCAGRHRRNARERRRRRRCGWRRTRNERRRRRRRRQSARRVARRHRCACGRRRLRDHAEGGALSPGRCHRREGGWRRRRRRRRKRGSRVAQSPARGAARRRRARRRCHRGGLR